jgi:hypothetical protein
MSTVPRRKKTTLAKWAVCQMLVSFGMIWMLSGIHDVPAMSDMAAMSGRTEALVRLLLGFALMIFGIEEMSNNAR